MADFRISRAALLKKTVSQLKKLAGPAQTATLNCFPDGVSLLASSHDGHLLGAVRINRENLNHFYCSHRFSIGVNLDRLCSLLNLADDENSVHIRTVGASSQLVVRFQNCQGHHTIKYVEFNCEANQMHVDFDRKSHEYVVKVGIATLIFAEMLQIIGDRIVSLTVTDEQARFGYGPDKCIALTPRHNISDCIIEGLRGSGDTIQTSAKLNLKCLLSWDASICESKHVWIYPSYRGGPPPALKYVTGEIMVMYYFLQ